MRTTVSIAVVAAALTSGCMGGGGEEAATTASAPQAADTVEEAPPAPLPPSSFTAEATPFQVVLTWETPPEGVQRFELFRDAMSLAIQPGTATSYTDDDVQPGRTYTYGIAAQTGDQVADRVESSVETPLPSLRAARVEGTFNVTTRIVSQSGYQDYNRPNFGWRFRPRCAEGPCTVRWSDLHTRRIRGTLKRTGARYRGGYTGKFFLVCGSAPATSVGTLDLKVDKARVMGDEWRATLLVGTLSHSEAAQLGCGYSEAELAVRARRAQ
jgi:hypothetical protein